MFKKIYNKVESKFPQVKILKEYYDKVRPAGRYVYLLEYVRKSNARKIMEIGTCTGRHAEKMIKEAQKNHPDEKVEYYGFDLFEMLDDTTSRNEIAIPPSSLDTIKIKLQKTGADIHLYQGYTKDTLPEFIGALPEMDFIYIDGGHSLQTIENDWKYAQQVMDTKTVVIFDDYWNRDDSGCKKLFESIDKKEFDAEILPIQDEFKKDWGVLKINFLKVIRINNAKK